MEKNSSTHERFIQTAKNGKILANKCKNCGKVMLETMYYCSGCSKSDFEFVEFPGIGTVVTHTIQAVAPEG
ncbi:MAG: nucleotide-binding protein, partial [Thermoproteota archaeon]|nr:nucleotide-binding protein [Thermoproteota archaeon]